MSADPEQARHQLGQIMYEAGLRGNARQLLAAADAILARYSVRPEVPELRAQVERLSGQLAEAEDCIIRDATGAVVHDARRAFAIAEAVDAAEWRYFASGSSHANNAHNDLLRSLRAAGTQVLAGRTHGSDAPPPIVGEDGPSPSSPAPYAGESVDEDTLSPATEVQWGDFG